jgi:hypothetical protein
MAAMNPETSPKEEEKPQTTPPVIKPIIPAFSLGMPKLNLSAKEETVPAHKEETVAEEKQQRVKVDLLVANLLDVKVDAKLDENSRKKIVTDEVKKKFKLQRGDKLLFDIFTIGEQNGEYSYICKPKTEGTFYFSSINVDSRTHFAVRNQATKRRFARQTRKDI